VCAAELPRVAHACPLCGLATPGAHCPRRGSAWYVAAVVAPLVYRPPVDFYLHGLKYRGRRLLGRALALSLVPTFAAVAGSVDALVAVPLHAARHRERGYNQAEEIARTLANELGLPLLRRGVERRAPTASQTMARAHERRANVANAFAVHGDVRGLRIAVVDDVITTGATVNALAAALLAAGAARCAAWAVARTLEP
jgi:ComF family protein